MYESYWNLTTNPFRNITDRNFFFYGKDYEEANLRLLYNITQSKGLLLLTGESGCGKSFVTKIFTQDMLGQGYQVAFISNPDLEPIEFLQQTLYEFGLSYEGKSKVELLRDLKHLAMETNNRGKQCILIVDDAHLIQSKKTWEEICLLLNLEQDGRFLFSIILNGQPELLTVIAKYPFLKERTALQYRINALNLRETGQYLSFRLAQAGAGRELFTLDAIKEIFSYSQGVPRKINNLCDIALLIGYGENAVMIDQTIVHKAIEDIQGISHNHLHITHPSRT